MISINPFSLNRCDWFLLLWVIYYLQGILYSEGSFLSILILGVNLSISIYYAIKVILLNDKPVYFKGLNLLLFLFTLYGILYIIDEPSVVYYPISGASFSSYNYIKSIYLSLLPIYPFYYFSKKGYLTQRDLQRWGFIFLASVMLSYFRYQQEALQKLMEAGSTREDITNNAGYLFLSCIPLLVLYRKKPLLQFTGLALVLVFIVLGMKRGAIGIGAFVALYFIFNAVKNYNKKIKITIIFLSIITAIGVTYFFLYQMAHNEYLMRRIQDTLNGNSSGRDDIYSFFWTYFTERAEFLHCLFGRGANGTLEIYYNYAHNDWLEIAVNQGLIGLIVYAIYWICFYKTYKRATNIEAKTILAIIIFIFFAKTLFSMSYGDMTYVSTSVLGYALATANKTNKISENFYEKN